MQSSPLPGVDDRGRAPTIANLPYRSIAQHERAARDGRFPDNDPANRIRPGTPLSCSRREVADEIDGCVNIVREKLFVH